MSRTITAMYDSRSEAEAAQQQLRSELGAEARIVDQSSSGSSSGTSGSSSGGGFWADLKDMFVADDDRSTYEEGVRRGGYLLMANLSEDQVDRACSILDQSGSVDFEQRENQWRSEGWQGSQSGPTAYSGSQSGQLGATGQRENVVEEERIPVIEEQLRVGKREIERGGARVRSYVEERPVTENVNLREEHVHVERRPVNEPLSAANLGEDALRERNIEMRETAEEAVVDKQARVVEEVLVQKTATEHNEQVQDTVRHTNVDVDEGGSDISRDRSAFGSFGENNSGSDTQRDRAYDSDVDSKR